jgi:uncharacterized protein
MSSLENRLYDRVRHPSARSVAASEQTVEGFGHLRGHKYCLLVSYKRSGEAVPTPVWFGLAAGNVYIRSEATAAKIRRIGNDPHVRVAPCSATGKPLGPPADARARVLGQASEQRGAEAALQANYGLGRRIYERLGRAETVYLEVTPS